MMVGTLGNVGVQGKFYTSCVGPKGFKSCTNCIFFIKELPLTYIGKSLPKALWSISKSFALTYLIPNNNLESCDSYSPHSTGIK